MAAPLSRLTAGDGAPMIASSEDQRMKLEEETPIRRQARSAVTPAIRERLQALYELPFNDLLFEAQTVHRRHFDANAVQLSTLLSIKTGGCPEDCGYCPQAARYHTNVGNEELLHIDDVVCAAQAAKEQGATRFCMGAAWRTPKQRDLDRVIDMVKAVRARGLETCATLGM